VTTRPLNTYLASGLTRCVLAIIILICFIISASSGGMLNAAAPSGSYRPELSFQIDQISDSEMAAEPAEILNCLLLRRGAYPTPAPICRGSFVPQPNLPARIFLLRLLTARRATGRLRRFSVDSGVDRRLTVDLWGSLSTVPLTLGFHKSGHGCGVSLSQISNLRFWSKLMCLSHSLSPASSLGLAAGKLSVILRPRNHSKKQSSSPESRRRSPRAACDLREA
jgi:hypothetical protein